MREFKFRAWHEKRKEIYDVHSLSSDYIFKDTFDGIGTNGVPDNRIDVILMQYTGLKDESDREIYEGDIVKITLHDTLFIIDVRFRYGKFWPFIGDDGYPSFDSSECSVIGNIYKNPELL